MLHIGQQWSELLLWSLDLSETWFQQLNTKLASRHGAEKKLS